VTDTVTPARRSQIMARVRGKNTVPEWTVRRLVHRMGYRYRLHVRALPGQPDLVFPRLHRVIFVHGCYWHRHARCVLARLPKSRLDFWLPKLKSNRERDQKSARALRRRGYKVLTVWECELADSKTLSRAIKGFLDA
jgi:DNA mismatch endonuclease (patch repair protein)